MRTKIIILAQGTQQRLVGVTTPKCLLPLFACNDAPIVGRTLRMCWSMESGETPMRARDNFQLDSITLVSWAEVFEGLTREATRLSSPAMIAYNKVSLPDPGNSSLKGIARYCDMDRLFRLTPDDFEQPTRYVVLFGDTVYSWDALQAVVKGRGREALFVGTGDLSNSGGELWGLSWVSPRATAMMSEALEHAMRRHPPVKDIYQPGQMRNWLWAVDGMNTHVRGRPWWEPVTGYTMDVDLPEHVKLLRDVSLKAAGEDAERGLGW